MSCNAIDDRDLPAIGIWIVSAVGTTTGENCHNRNEVGAEIRYLHLLRR